jgi:outer membrane protein OmpA-like peptidoglycan-associated protein
MVIKLRFYFILLFLVFFKTVSANKFIEDIRITILVVNDVDGTEIKSADLVVSEAVGGRIIKPTKGKTETYYVLPEGKDIKVKAKAAGYYTEDRLLIGSEIRSGQILNLRLSRKIAGEIKITTVDSETKLPVESNVEITFFSNKSNKKLDKIIKEYIYLYDLAGKYKILVTAKGYLNYEQEHDLEIIENQPGLIIELQKNRINQLVELKDNSSNENIRSGTMTVLHNVTGQKIFSGKIVNGKVNFDGNKNETYSVEIIAEGFTTVKKTFKMDGNILKYELTPLTSYEIDIFDDETDKRISVNLEIVSPKGLKTLLKSLETESIKYFPNEIGTYSIVSKGIGYINKSGTFIIKTIDGGSSFYTLRLKKGSNEYEISVFDFDTKAPIDVATIKVFNDQSKEISGKKNKNTFTVNLEGEKKHFFEITAKEYADYTANVLTEKNIPVYLKKKQAIVLDKYEFVVVDDVSKQPIKDAKFRVFDSNDRMVQLSFDANTQKYQTDKIVSTQVYSYEASAKGFNNIKESLSLNEKSIIIPLTIAGLKTYSFEFKDAITKNSVSGDFKLVLADKTIPTEKKGNIFTGVLNTFVNCKGTFIATDYIDFDKDILKTEVKDDMFKYEIFKKTYSVYVKFIPNIDQSVLVKGNIKVNQKSKKEEVYINLMSDKNGFGFEAKPNTNYDIIADIEGFEKYTGAYLLNAENAARLIYEIKLISKNAKPIKEEPKKEIIIEEPKKLEPKPVLTDKTIKLTPESAELESYSNLKVGTRYKLKNVGFEQSRATLTKGSNAELEQLAQYLVANPKLWIEITGHSDNEGNDQRLNQRLSEFRAKAISNYMFNKGINPERITIFGKGSTEPVAINDTEENKAKNRRVEIVLSQN